VNSLDLVVAAAVGGVFGWMAHALYRQRNRVPVREEERRAPVVPSLPANAPGSPPPPILVAGPVPPVAVAAAPVSEGARVAGRVILHLYGLGRLELHDVAPVGFTQRGLGATLGLRQGTIAKVLSRLLAAGVLQVEKRHVSGETRRLNIYSLTRTGEAIARDLQRRARVEEVRASAVVFRLGDVEAPDRGRSSD
jgi:DNA-binding MarR family transcriptional regulator